MKRIFLAAIVFLMLIFEVQVQAQTDLTKDYKGNYLPTTIYTGTDQAVGDTSSVFKIPTDITQGIFYVNPDTISASDTLKTQIVQASPDMTTWYTLTTFNDVTVSGTLERKAVTLVDLYIRYIFATSGTTIAHDFTVKFVPKK